MAIDLDVCLLSLPLRAHGWGVRRGCGMACPALLPSPAQVQSRMLQLTLGGHRAPVPLSFKPGCLNMHPHCLLLYFMLTAC